MSSEPPRCSDLAALREDVRAKAILWLATVRTAGGRAKAVAIGETARTPERQDWLYASGRTRPGMRVTNLRGDDPAARHVARYGEATAWDFWFVAPGLSPWDPGHPWVLAGVVGEYLGLTWGGRWRQADLGHLEYNGPNPYTTPSAASLRVGSTGEIVRVLQQSLAARGFDPGPADGVYGPRTEAAVRELQRLGGLEVTGIVDAITATRAGVALT